MSDHEESALIPSEPETQFIPQEDDDEFLWEVIEITAEKKKLYRVRWKGFDPKTQKPWPQSWVAKHDCTDDLVRNWKLKQAQKKMKSLLKRESVMSKESRAVSTVKSSGSIPPPPRKKKKLQVEVEIVNSQEHSAGIVKSSGSISPSPPPPPRKKKKLEVEIVSSQEHSAGSVKSISLSPPPPPRKKKKLEVVIVSSHEHSAGSTEVDVKGRKRKGSNPVIASHDRDDDNYVGTKSKSEEVEERMVEGSLSDSQRPSPPQEPTQGQARLESPAGSGSHSLSGRGTKSIPSPISRYKEVGSPGPSATSSTSIVTPTTTPPRKGSGANDEEHGHKSPILSPRAKERLEIFDRAMMEIELREGKEREQRLEDGILFDKVKEREAEEEEMVVGGRLEHAFVRTSEGKSWKGKDKEQMKEDKARTSTPKPPEIKKRKKAESSYESDFQDKPALRPKSNVGSEGGQGVEASLVVASNDIDMDTQTTSIGVVEQQLDPMHLRQEEEESTQDLMEELRCQLEQRQGFEVGWSGALVPEIINDTGDHTGDHLPAIQIDSQPISEAMLDTSVQNRGADNNEKSNRFLDEIPSIIVENPSRASSARSHSSLEDGDGSQKVGPRTFKSRSRSRSVSSQQNRNEESDSEAVIPPTASTYRESLQALSQPAVSQTESPENPHYMGAAMHLLNTKSEEISRLEDRLSTEERRNKDLLQQHSALQLHLTELNNATPSITKALEQELAEARAQLALQTASWEIDRAAFVLNVETATRGKVSAENDRDFFREQYAKASGFVSSVRDEKAELEKRIKIATDQTQSGVSLIKTTFELRMKSLEKDVRSWRRMAEFLVEKDRRTNDDIRRRAAEEPELRARCDRQESAFQYTSERLLQLEVDLEAKQKMLLEEQMLGKGWQETTVKLNLELNEAMTKLEKIGKVGIHDGDESAYPNGHEFVYRCQWRPDDLNDACEAVFLNLSELQEHLFTGGHLQH